MIEVEYNTHESVIAYHVSEATDHINDAINESREEGYRAGGKACLELMRLGLAWAALFHAAVWLTRSSPGFAHHTHLARWKGYEQAAETIDMLLEAQS